MRTIALPPEHGTWGLVLEPILLGLAVAPSLAGVLLACGAFAAFLVRRPFKVRLAQVGLARTRRKTLAELFLALYAILALAGTVAAVALSGPTQMVPLALVSPLLAVFVIYDLKNRTRSWQAELAGTIAFAAVAGGITLADNWSLPPALALAGVVAARGVPSVLYIRSRLRLDRGRASGVTLTIVAHIASLALVLWLVNAALLPFLTVFPFVVLLGRAITGLSPRRRQVPVKTLGFIEMGFGILTVVAVATGYWLGL